MRREMGRPRHGVARVLICDFDFFSTIGGGQVFYRRVVERNPDLDFFYPSRARDLALKSSGRLPGNAHPFLIGATAGEETRPALDSSLSPAAIRYAEPLAIVAAAVRGETFDVADFPSFFPAAHLARPIFARFGITASRIVVSMMGWNSVSCRAAYEDLDELADALEAEETACADRADVLYTISQLEQTLHRRGASPVQQLDMHDFLEEFPPPDPRPPGSGPPDLWYVGRLDGAKGPDIFIELASRMPRRLYHRCCLAGPDNAGPPEARWSTLVKGMARSRGVSANYVGMPCDATVRREAYRGRSVVVVPSRSDSFNYVALEALLNGCPVLLSSRAGASGFLAREHPALLPPIMDPDDVDDAATKLRIILEEYQQAACRLRLALRSNPFPSPRINMMSDIYGLTGHPVA
jgi:glycosyltransferase involved in cell wall biosynthesis